MLTERQFTDAAEWYLGMVYRITLNWFQNPADAEDVVQDAMLCPWETDTDFQRGGAPVPLAWVVLNKCKRMYAHPWRRRTVPPDQCRSKF